MSILFQSMALSAPVPSQSYTRIKPYLVSCLWHMACIFYHIFTIYITSSVCDILVSSNTTAAVIFEILVEDQEQEKPKNVSFLSFYRP